MHLTDFNFNVDQLSRKVYLSQSQLKRKLNALAGISPNHFIRFIRLSKAKTLLLNPERSIISIAFDCGFSDPGYFARVFKQNFGLRPQEWRAKNQ
jgi:AraC-like DNA-binding protein